MKYLVFAITLATAILADGETAMTPFQRVNYSLNAAESAAKDDKILVAYIDARARFRRSHDPVDNLIVTEIESYFKHAKYNEKKYEWKATLEKDIDIDSEFIKMLDSSVDLMCQRPLTSMDLYNAYRDVKEKRAKLWTSLSELTSIYIKRHAVISTLDAATK